MKIKHITVALAAAAMIVLGSASSVFALTYAAPTINLAVPGSVAGGTALAGSATSNQACSWSITFSGGTSTEQPITGSTGPNVPFEFSFLTTEVESSTTGTVTAVCTYDDGVSSRAAANQTLTTSADVTVTGGDVSGPTTDDGSGVSDDGALAGLADTGGPSLWLAIIGGSLTALGAGAVIRSRRTHA